ncbi:hypothetical protein G0Q06_12220 [Puniceicoccales bacterium CK1056]|uniref:HEAT repeat protein n=1 Tax=Oceanipulchritudo coccoides TaxID=2706888 RepID=A0A6B2M4L3_9BACT|nr:HEAT repeat domain-containing protein [Oceanipulchritudo coccoides]NDV63222.1 hypothetical protein [Oceanipulchritudo coccoides]
MQNVNPISHLNKVHARPLTCLLLGFILVFPLQISGQNTQANIEETVNNALMDLRSGLPEKRRGGIMLLAKYPQHPSALPAIVSALDDPEATVRRAAAVSLGENIRTLNPMHSSRLVGALTDEDPEVRLTSAGWLPQLVLKSSTFPTIRPPQGSAQPDPKIREFLVTGVSAGLQDPEPLVRLKSVEALQYIRWPLPHELMVPLLGDPDQRVRLKAYQTLYSKLPHGTYITIARSLYPDESPGVRLVLAEVLSRQAIPGSVSLLMKLAEDPVASVQLQATVGLFQADPASGFPDILKTALMDKNLEASVVYRVFNAVNRLSEEDRKRLIAPLLKSSSATVRGQAVLRWLQWNPDGGGPDFMDSVLTDPASEIRQVAIRYFSSRPAQLDRDTLMALAENPFEDVRRQALTLSAASSPEDQAALALRLLMDTLPDIRIQSISRIIQLRPSNWSRILKASLRDPSPEVQRTTAKALLDELGPEGQQIATEFVHDYPDSEISSLIRMRLGIQ